MKTYLFDFDGTLVDSMPSYVSAMLKILDDNGIKYGDDFSITKSDPEIYKMVAEKLGERVENVLFLDDNLNADKTAKQAGMKVCGVYDDSSKEYITDIKEVADYYIYNFSELLDIDINN